MKNYTDTKLITACDSGDFHTLRDAISEGANVNYKSGKGSTPLIIAAGKDPKLVPVLSFVKYLIANGANVGAQTSKGKSSLSTSLSIYNIDPDVVEYLLKSGADPNITRIVRLDDKSFNASLMDMSDINNFPPRLVNMLASYGGKYNLSPDERVFAKTHIRSKLCPHTISSSKRKTLIEDMDNKMPNAFENNNTDEIYNMISAGADYRAKNEAGNFLKTKDGRTLLHIGAEKSDMTLIKRLLSAGFDLNEKDEKGRTPIKYVKKDKRLEQYLIDHGAASPKPPSSQRILKIIENFGNETRITNGRAELTLSRSRNKHGRASMTISDYGLFWELIYNPDTGEVEDSTDRSSDPYFKWLDPYDFIVKAEMIQKKAFSEIENQ